MGQVALGFRSLLIKGVVFFIMAALLAWALGGTLWPRAEIVDLDPVTFQGEPWFWRLSVGGREPGRLSYTIHHGAADDASPLDEQRWVEVAGPRLAGEHLYYAGRTVAGSWVLERVSARGVAEPVAALPDRLAVERQLARLAAGLPLQDSEQIAGERDRVIDPAAIGPAAFGDSQ
ncbi:MAG: hypothetical protein HKO59_00390 [Phycisphaerales bacterium]|nr:hypothetical protein [Phycisphaerales bacterium]